MTKGIGLSQSIGFGAFLNKNNFIATERGVTHGSSSYSSLVRIGFLLNIEIEKRSRLAQLLLTLAFQNTLLFSVKLYLLF